MEWNLDVAGALLEPLDGEAEPRGSALRLVVRACRLADGFFDRGEWAAAREVLEIPAVHATVEVQSAARLARAYLALEPATPHDVFRKAVALTRFAGIDSSPRWSRYEIPGLGWGPERLPAIAAESREWLDGLGRRQAATAPPNPVASSRRDLEPASRNGQTPPVATSSSQTHSLPPIAHEVMRELVPGLDAAVREAVRYARAQPGWDDTQTLGDDLPEFTPVKAFLDAYLSGLVESGVEYEEAFSRAELLGRHLDYCVNFELHRRKLFHADASLAWLLAHTSLDIEGRALRLPFPCFGLVFTDRATLDVAETLLRKARDDLAGRRVQILTIYARRLPAPAGRSGLGLWLVFDARTAAWPALLGRELCFSEEDDLDAILDSHFAGADPARLPLATRLPEMRELVHLAVNAILYSTSANVPWPLTRSPIHRLRSESRSRGKAKRARVEHRIDELGRKYSSEDVFYLPGRIPISQLRELQQVERHPSGHEMMARFMVRGHWRRANPGWVDQRLRWIEPYWKGPELAAIVEREYKLKI
jgi:hypothetical protein